MSESSYLHVHYSEERRPTTEYPQLLAQRLVSLFELGANARLLDVGSGRAEVSRGFQEAGLSVTCLDHSPAGQQFAALAELDFIQHDVSSREPLPFESNSYDIIFCKSLIEHLAEPLPFLQDCHRVLNHGGRLIVLTPDWQANHKIFFDDVTHVKPFTVESLRQALEMTGYRDVSSETFRQLPVTWRWPSVNLLSACLAPFVPVRTKNKFFRWSRELMICGSGLK